MWQPIETADTEASLKQPILVYCKPSRYGGGVRVAWYNDEYWTDYNNDYDMHLRATHWMPLPDPPKDVL